MNKDDKLTQSQMLARMMEAEMRDNESMNGNSERRRGGPEDDVQEDIKEDEVNDDNDDVGSESYVSSSIASSTDFHAAIEAQKAQA